jgi:ribosomal protein L11 methyltransferase
MTTFSAITTLSGREAADHLAEVLEDFEAAPDDIALALLATAFTAAPFAVSEIPETDWVAHVKRELQPVEAGRFFVYGSHDADRVPADRVPLLIEAAMAFGTGHHGTTKGCLLALERLAGQGFQARNAVDIGCGTAVLAMAAASIWPDPVLASDIDPVAVEVARANVVANGLEGRVTCLEAAGFDAPALRAAAPYDLVFANILKGPLIALAPDMARSIAPDGVAILSGILNQQADEVSGVYQEAGFSLLERDEQAEWTTLVLRRGQ